MCGIPNRLGANQEKDEGGEPALLVRLDADQKEEEGGEPVPVGLKDEREAEEGGETEPLGLDANRDERRGRGWGASTRRSRRWPR